MTLSLLQHVQTSSGTHHASYSKGTWTVFPALNYRGCEVGQSSLSSAKFEKEWNCKLHSHTWLHGVQKDNFTFFTITNNNVFYRMSVYRCPEHNCCHGINRRMKTFYSINLTYSRKKKTCIVTGVSLSNVTLLLQPGISHCRLQQSERLKKLSFETSMRFVLIVLLLL
jgi:hypothetical protein